MRNKLVSLYRSLDVLLVASLLFCFYQGHTRNKEIDMWMLRSAAGRVHVALLEMQGSQRLFLLTGSPYDLDKYSYNKHLLTARFDYLCRILPTANVAICKPLKTLIDEKVAEMEATVDLEQKGKHKEAVAIVGTGRGVWLMGQISDALDKIRLDASMGIRNHTEPCVVN